MTPVDIIKQRKKFLDAKYKRDGYNIHNYIRREEVANILSLVERASQRHPDSTQSGSEIPPCHHHTSVDSYGGFNDGGGI